MPEITDPERVSALRKQFPTLTHTTWKQLDTINPHDNVNKYREHMGEIVCATSGNMDRDFYALRCNEKEGMTNMQVPALDSNGNLQWIFVLEKMKDEYFQHVVSSKDFRPVESPVTHKFEGEWIARQDITPLSVTRGTKEDVLKRTAAHVFTITDIEAFKHKLRIEKLADKVMLHPELAFEVLGGLVAEGLLKKENDPDSRPSLNKSLSAHGKEHKPQKVDDKVAVASLLKRAKTNE